MDGNVDNAIRELPAKGFIRFSIKANDTNENQAIHDGFKKFCEVETDSNYTQGLKRLLEHIEMDYKYEALYDKIASQASDIVELKQEIKKLKEKPNKEEGMF